MTSPLRGQRLLHYQLLEKIGEGGMGVVYKASDTHLDRFVAIKLLPPDKVADTERRSRFVQEAKAASALRHPNIVTIHDIASDQGHDFIVMEYVGGKPLDQLIGRHGLKLQHAIRYGIQAADALARAHSAGIIHRDIKPSNVIVDEHGQVKVLDFGLAKLTEPRPVDGETTQTVAPVTEDGKVVGTAAYLSPEQAEGRRVDTRSDIFSFGSTLYEMVTGRRPFQGESAVSTMAAILNSDPAPFGAEVPTELQRIILRCLRKDPERRWQSMADLRVALEDFREDSESGVSATQTRRKSAFGWKAAAVGAVALGLSATGLWYVRANKMTHATDTPKVIPLTAYPGRQQSPTFSPDAAQIAFSWCRDNGCAIYIKQIGVEEPYRLSGPPDNAYSPEWSPDGAYIAFQRRITEPEARWRYVVVPQRGGAERVVADFPRPLPLSLIHGSRNIAWSPDSKRLIVTGTDDPRQRTSLFEVNVSGGVPRKLVEAPSGEAIGDPALSHDGKHLAYCRARTEVHSDLYVASIEDGVVAAPVRIAAELTQIADPAWVSGSGEVLFYAHRPGLGHRLWRMRPKANASPSRVSGPEEAGALDISFGLSRTGKLAWTRTVGHDVDVFRIKASDAGKFGPPERFISSTAMEFGQQFSPDGTKIALNSFRSGSNEVWVFDSDGSNPISLTADGPENCTRPRWAPDGRSIAFYSSDGPNIDVYVVGASGGKPRRLTDGSRRHMNPEWSCDSSYVYFQADGSGEAGGLWKLPAHGGAPVRVRKGGSASETRDCKYLVFGAGWPDEYRVYRQPLPSGEPELLAENLHPRGDYVVFPEGVYYFGNSPSAGGYPLLFRTTSGATREIARVPSPFWGLTVSPDRKTILYASQKPGDSNLVMLDGFR